MAVEGKRRANRVHVAKRERSEDDSESTSRTFGGADGMSVCSPGKPDRGSDSQHDKTAVGQPKVDKHVGSHAGGRNWVTGDGSQQKGSPARAQALTGDDIGRREG